MNGYPHRPPVAIMPSFVPDEELVSLALAGLSPATVGNQRKYLSVFARYRQADSTGAALRELIGLPRDEAMQHIAGFRTDQEARGLSPKVIADRESTLRGAVRQLRKAGFTTLDLDREWHRTEPRIDPDGLVAFALKGLKPSSAQKALAHLNVFARFRKADSAEDALRELIGLPYDRANRLASAFQVELVARGLVPLTIGGMMTTLVRAVNELRRSGLTTLMLDVDRSACERTGAAAGLMGLEDRHREGLLARAEAEAGTCKGRSRNPALLLLLETFRPRHVLALDLADVDLSGRCIRIEGQRQEIDERTREKLARWVEIRGDWPGPLFTQGRNGARHCSRVTPGGLVRIISGLARRAGIGFRVTPRDLRTGVATKRLDDDGFIPPERPKGGSRPGVTIGRQVEHPIIRGHKKKCLGNSAFDVVLSLCTAGEKGLSKRNLIEKSGHKNAITFLRRLREDPDWKWALIFPDDDGKPNYRIRFIAT